MNLYIKFFPFLYTFFISQKGSFANIIRYLYKYIFFPFLSVIIFSVALQREFNFLDAVLYYLVFILIYEVGNIFNDTIITKFEKKPTIRIYNWNYKILLYSVFIRLFIFVFFIIFYKVNLFFLVLCTILVIVFTLHNLIRNIWFNFLTFFILRFLKFVVVFSVFNISTIREFKLYMITFVVLFGLYYIDEEIGYVIKKINKYITDIYNVKKIIYIIIISKFYLFYLTLFLISILNYVFAIYFILALFDFISLKRNFNLLINNNAKIFNELI